MCVCVQGKKFDEHAGQILEVEPPIGTAPSVQGVADAIVNAKRQGNYVDVGNPNELINVRDFYKRLSFLFLHRTGHYAPLSEQSLEELDEMMYINDRMKNQMVLRMEEEQSRYLIQQLKASMKKKKAKKDVNKL
jgi:hypothetical protein